MTKIELKEKLDAAGISPESYSLNGGLFDECHTLDGEGDKWSVYYSERGEKNALHYFQSEPAACQFFLERVLNDPTTRR